MYVKLDGAMVYRWRGIDHEGEVLVNHITKSRDKQRRSLSSGKALKRHGRSEAITTDGLRSCGAAVSGLGDAEKRDVGRWANNRVENSHARSDDENGRC